METRPGTRPLLLAVFALALAAVPAARADEDPAPKTTSTGAADAQGTPDGAPDESVPAVIHAPVGTTPAGKDWSVPARIRGAHKLAEVRLHYRRRGEGAFRVVKFNRAPLGDYAAVVDNTQVLPGIMEYYIGSTSAEAPDGPERLHFGSPAAPHPLIVSGDNEARFKDELLARHLGNRSRFSLMGEYVDFGGRTVTDGNGGTRGIRDHYWRGEVDYTFRMLSWVYSIRLGVGLLRGDSYLIVDPNIPLYGSPTDPVGLTYGFAELRFRFGRLVRLDTKAILGASGRGFDGGGGGQLLIGFDPGTHFAVGIEGVSHLGMRAWLRLAWNTVPRVPMAFTVETNNLPIGDEFGGRVYFSASYRFHRYFSMNASVGYAARDKAPGGPTVSLGADVEF